MDLTEFKDAILEIATEKGLTNQVNSLVRYKNHGNTWDSHSKWKLLCGYESSAWNHKDDRYTQYKHVIGLSVETGGWSGGNCWEGEATPYHTNEKLSDLTLLDEVLLKFSPKTSFLEYKKLTNTLVVNEQWTVGEYYGNSTDYIGHYIIVDDLFNYLEDNKLFE